MLISLASETQTHLKDLLRTMSCISTMSSFLLISYGYLQENKTKSSRETLPHPWILTLCWQNWDRDRESTWSCMRSRVLGRIMLNSVLLVCFHLVFSTIPTFFLLTFFVFVFLFLATASYRLLPHIKITKPIPLHLAEKFQKCFSPGVINIDPRTHEVSVDERNVRKDTVSREVLRHPEFADSVELSRVRDYFLCMFLFMLGLYTSLSSFGSLTLKSFLYSLRWNRRAVCSGKDIARSNQGHEREVGCHNWGSCGVTE